MKMIKVLKKHMFTGLEPSTNFQLGLKISANSVGNIYTAKLLQKSKKQFASR